MVQHGSRRSRNQRRRATVTAATTATALAAGLTVGTPSAGAASCSVTATEIGDGVFEVRFTSTTACDWTIPEGATQLEALLVGSGGGSVWAYAGGGGEVTLVDLSGTTGNLGVTVGASSSYGSGSFGTPPSRTGADTVLTAGSTTHTATGGWAGASDASNECGGKSGNDNLGHCNYSDNDGGGGAAGAANADGDGGVGVIVDSIAGATSLFDGVTDCYGGGGASGETTFSSYPTLTAYSPKTPGCSGGEVTITASLPADVTTVTFTHQIDANTGGGAGARDASNDGSDGLVVIRYAVAEESAPSVDDLGDTGANVPMFLSFAAALLASGAVLAATERRRSV